MLQVTVKLKDRIVRLPTLKEGESASMTDYRNPGTEIVIFGVHDNKAYVLLSKAGASVEFGNKRLVISDDIKTERIIEKGGKFIRDMMTKHGEGILVVEYL